MLPADVALVPVNGRVNLYDQPPSPGLFPGREGAVLTFRMEVTDHSHPIPCGRDFFPGKYLVVLASNIAPLFRCAAHKWF